MSLMSFKLQTFNSLHQEQPTISQIQSDSIMHQDDSIDLGIGLVWMGNIHNRTYVLFI